MSAKHNKVSIVVLIGGGSKLPALIKATKEKSSKFELKLVVSHKSSSLGINLAIENNIPAVFFNLPDYRKRLFGGDIKARADYMQKLGWFISQKEYSPKLLVFAGWDLVMDKNFFDFFKCSFGNDYAAVNLHPAILPEENEGEIKMPDGLTTPVIKGEQTEVLQRVLDNKLTYFGPTVHFMVPSGYDTGKIVQREFIKVGSAKSISDLRKKLLPVEDKILVSSIKSVIEKYLS
jgi:folate-dependent phosphoribosylglycinamide formyltransferase PurN